MGATVDQKVPSKDNYRRFCESSTHIQPHLPVSAPCNNIPMTQRTNDGIEVELPGKRPRVFQPFLKVAKVEVQLCMRFCDLRSLVAFAKCNKSMFVAAQGAFAWGGQHHHTIRLPWMEQYLAWSTSPYSLLRFVKCSFNFDTSETIPPSVARWNLPIHRVTLT